jgi:alkanesulfonate monooxygenase SsuD/methylene tetrahydromethanopterin reductase-like flavin-dependent oxidoreductase (luciferase family)
VPPGGDPAEVYEGRSALLAEADAGDEFAVYHLAEHHGTPLGLAPSPGLFLATAARATSRIRLAPTTYIVPLYDPLRLAQEIAMLDQLSHGRLEVGVGKGSSPHEAAMFGLTAAQAAERFEELLPVVIDALSSDRFAGPADLDQLVDEGKLFIGSPRSVAGQVEEAVTAGEVNYVAGSFAWGSLPPDAARHSLRLFRDEVVPVVRRAARRR